MRDWLVPNFRATFRASQAPVDYLLANVEALLQATPFPVFWLIAVLLAWRAAGRGVGIFTALSLLLINAIGVWSGSMTTLAMIVTAVSFCAVVGIPLGILAARSDRFAAIIRPFLDIMQTIPPFV